MIWLIDILIVRLPQLLHHFIGCSAPSGREAALAGFFLFLKRHKKEVRAFLASFFVCAHGARLAARAMPVICVCKMHHCLHTDFMARTRPVAACPSTVTLLYMLLGYTSTVCVMEPSAVNSSTDDRSM